MPKAKQTNKQTNKGIKTMQIIQRYNSLEEVRLYQTFKKYEFCISKCFCDPTVYELVVVKLNDDFIEKNFIEHEEFEEFNELKRYLILHYDLEIFEKDFRRFRNIWKRF